MPDFVKGAVWHKVRKTLTPQQNRGIEYQLGQITAQINAYDSSVFGYYALDKKFDEWTDAFHFMFELLLSDADRYEIDLPVSWHDLAALLKRHAGHFAEVERPQLVHWDLWEGNILVDVQQEEPVISGVIDFERAFWGDPLCELYFRRADNAAFVEGYGQDLLSTRAQHIRTIFYDIYLDLVMVIEDGPRQYTDKGSVNWARDRLDADLARLREETH